MFRPSADVIGFTTGGTERLRISAAGNIGINVAPTQLLDIYSATNAGGIIRSDAAANFTVSRSSTDATGPQYIVRKSRGTNGASTAVVANDLAGSVIFQGHDGTGYQSVAQIQSLIDTITGTDNISSYLRFMTRNDGAAASPVERFRVTKEGYVRLSTNGLGIQFNGNTAAANALNDYEEGTFTPTVVGTTTAGTGTYSAQQGSYTRVGNIVVFRINLTWTAHTGTGNIQINGLPWQVALTTPHTIIGQNLTYTNTLVARSDGATSSIVLLTQSSGAAAAALAMDTAATVTIQGAYRV
jgi:hypothetical protein